MTSYDVKFQNTHAVLWLDDTNHKFWRNISNMEDREWPHFQAQISFLDTFKVV